VNRPHRRLARLFLSLMAVVGLVLAGTVLTASPAVTHTKLSPRATCPGSELSPHHDLFGGQVSVFVAYSSARGGTNCAWPQKNVNRGTEEFLDVWIDRCATGDPEFGAGELRAQNHCG